MQTLILASLLFFMVLATDPKLPGQDAKQYSIRSVSPHSETQASSNWVDRENEQYRIDTFEKGVLFGQQFYYGKLKEGYLLEHHTDKITCRKYNDDGAVDQLKTWNSLKYVGIGPSVHNSSIRCHVWNQGTVWHACSQYSTVEGNIPYEFACMTTTMSLYKDFKVGPSAIPKGIFDFPIDKKGCK